MLQLGPALESLSIDGVGRGLSQYIECIYSIYYSMILYDSPCTGLFLLGMFKNRQRHQPNKHQCLRILRPEERGREQRLREQEGVVLDIA